MNKVKKPAYAAVFLLTTLVLTNAVFIRSVSGNRGSATDPDFNYSSVSKATPEVLGYLAEPAPANLITLSKTQKTQENYDFLPGSFNSVDTTPRSFKSLEKAFILPTPGFNWGEIHGVNAVDIANYCGALVFSAYSGEVIADPNYGSGLEGWNGGYGLFVLIKHTGSLQTRYAHLVKVMVGVGDYVRQGTLIGYVGASGNVHGVTGCHVHFEVLGGNNPFAK